MVTFRHAVDLLAIFLGSLENRLKLSEATYTCNVSERAAWDYEQQSRQRSLYSFNDFPANPLAHAVGLLHTLNFIETSSSATNFPISQQQSSMSLSAERRKEESQTIKIIVESESRRNPSRRGDKAQTRKRATTMMMMMLQQYTHTRHRTWSSKRARINEEKKIESCNFPIQHLSNEQWMLQREKKTWQLVENSKEFVKGYKELNWNFASLLRCGGWMWVNVNCEQCYKLVSWIEK